MKWSIYNEFINGISKDYEVLYNTLRGKYFAIEPKLKDLVIKCINNIQALSEIHPDLYKSLLLENFIIPDNINEVDACIQKLKNKFSSKSQLRITINPTLDCNLRCWYCYESHIKGSYMDQNVIDSIIKFVRNQVCSQDIDSIHLSFFGGEPLLKYNKVVKPIIQECKNICSTHDKDFLLSITTNGICLTKDVVDEISNMGITFSVQVAFDGNKPIHDSVKYFSNRKGSYDIVVKNLRHAIEKGVNVTIRCNYTKSNLLSFKEVIKDFELYKYYTNVRFSFHKVWQEPESQDLFDKREQMKTVIEESGIKSNINSYWGNSLASCYADYESNVIVNYNGDIFKCTARDFKPNHRLGYLNSEGYIVYDDTSMRFSIEANLTSQCRGCRLLPICTICFQQRKESTDGKCPTPALHANASKNIQKYFHDIIKL